MSDLNKMRKKYSFVYPSLPDRRDRIYEAKADAFNTKASLAEFRGPILYQGRFGACTGFGTAGMLYEFFNRVTGVQINFNPYWIWYWAKDKVGWPKENKGAYPRDVFQNLIDVGVCEAHDWKMTSVKEDPPQLPESELIKFKGYKRFDFNKDDIDSIKNDFFYCIGVERLPIGITVAVHESFETYTKDHGEIIIPKDNTSILGYHWVYVDEVDEDGVTLVNSWSKHWGKDGTAFMPWEYVLKYVVEAWSLDPELP